MKLVLSPAKSLNFENVPQLNGYTQPAFLKESESLVGQLKKMTPKKIGDLMNVSEQLSNLNYQRYQDWKLPFTQDNAKPALYVFTGDAYRGMDARSFSEEEVNFANTSLRILSGLYGVLKPSDLMQPYRLEMGTKFPGNQKAKNLYQFWGDKIVDALNEEMNEQEALVNIASNEYFKAINTKKLKGKLITCLFKENKAGVYKVVMSYAKFARGLMARFVIQNKINEVEHLKAFDLDGYMFNNSLSTDNEFVFTRG